MFCMLSVAGHTRPVLVIRETVATYLIVAATLVGGLASYGLQMLLDGGKVDRLGG